ncbi:MAG: hypothetical protein WCL32_14415 [Planctomycetota bacterium]
MRIVRANAQWPHTLATSFGIVSPMPQKAYRLNDYAAGSGTMAVIVDRTANNTVNRFLCRIDDSATGEMPAEYNEAGCSVLTQSLTMADRFQNPAVPVRTVDTQSPAPNSMEVPGLKYLKVASYDVDGHRVDQEPRTFTPTPPVFNTTVSSKACLWLSFAEDTFAFNQTGDYHESVTGGYRPTTLLVPQDATAVRVEANPADRWAHHPKTDRRSSAVGIPGAENLVALARPDIYKANRAGLHSAAIDGTVRLPFNALVAVLDRGPNVATSVELVGLDHTFALNPTILRIFLGFHDNYEWSNNTDPALNFDQVHVKVTWS